MRRGTQARFRDQNPKQRPYLYTRINHSYTQMMFRWAAALCMVLGLLAGQGAKAQEKQQPSVPQPGNMTRQGKEIIQFSGLVVAGEKAFGVPGVNVTIPRSRRGTTTNALGYFSIPVVVGDTAQISAIGYRRRIYIVPAAENASHSVIIYLEADTMQLPVVDVVPFPTEALFKEAFLALKLDNRDVENARRNLDPYAIDEMAREQPMDGKMNYTSAMNAQVRRIETGSGKSQATLSLLDPFAWARFIESVKRGDLKKKDKKDRED